MSSLEMSAICRDPGMVFVAEAKQADPGNTIPSLPPTSVIMCVDPEDGKRPLVIVESMEEGIQHDKTHRDSQSPEVK